MNKVIITLLKRWLLLPLVCLCCYAQAQDKTKTLQYASVLAKAGRAPKAFVIEQLKKHDLILFDDALHTAKDPFDFYIDLLKDSTFHNTVKYVFVEVFSANYQPYIDNYLNAPTNDSSILFPVFQNDIGEYGWSYKTYFDLLNAIRGINQGLPANERLKVIAVNAPSYWPLLQTAADVEAFRNLAGWNDYAMYKNILSALDNFKAGKKGIFLTNTRHAYKGIKDSTGTYFWNSGTFFRQWHPGKTYSIRFHNAALIFKLKAQPATVKTMQGLEKVDISWRRMEDGVWDAAFIKNGSKPVAIDINQNVFGKAAYIGNHMLNALPKQTMKDAYDAIIFLKPLEALQETAKVDWIYTPNYLKELERRMHLLMGPDEIAAELKSTNSQTVQEYLKKILAPREARLNPITKSLPPLNNSYGN